MEIKKDKKHNTNILIIEAQNKNHWSPIRFFFGSTNLDKFICHNWNKDNAGTQAFSWTKQNRKHFLHSFEIQKQNTLLYLNQREAKMSG